MRPFLQGVVVKKIEVIVSFISITNIKENRHLILNRRLKSICQRLDCRKVNIVAITKVSFNLQTHSCQIFVDFDQPGTC
jgi:hypothetical protein